MKFVSSSSACLLFNWPPKWRKSTVCHSWSSSNETSALTRIPRLLSSWQQQECSLPSAPSVLAWRKPWFWLEKNSRGKVTFARYCWVPCFSHAPAFAVLCGGLPCITKLLSDLLKLRFMTSGLSFTLSGTPSPVILTVWFCLTEPPIHSTAHLPLKAWVAVAHNFQDLKKLQFTAFKL